MSGIDILTKIMNTLANAPAIALNDLYKNTTDERDRDTIKNFANSLNIELGESNNK